MKMKLVTSQAAKRAAQGFTLIEMIGVLAVIAILAAVLIPKVFEAINNSKVNNAAMSCQTVKTALVDHYAKYGSLLSSNGVTLTTAQAGDFDTVLLKEGFLDKPFECKISTDANVRVAATNTMLVTDAPTVANQSFALSGDVAVNDAVGSVVAVAIIPGVTESDAKDLNDRIDGTTLGVPLNTVGGDLKGRVKYATAATTTVYVYLTHR
jgi:prepilin-type N-terminal cleavage/methylation domain-containing protein